MKFGKELASQMVQEWGEAYMDYTSLKGLLKDILKFRQTKAAAQSSAAATLKNSLKRRLSMYRAFSGLANRFSTTPRSNDNNEEDIILVSGVEQEGSIGAPPQYQTTFLVSSEAGGEYELVFFRRLDDEFNKVVGFYREKVEEARKEADELSEQMDALIAFRIMVQKPEIQLHAAAQRKDNNSAAATNARKQGHEFESLLF